MIVEYLRAREFRCYQHLEVRLGRSVSVVTGDNGAGKTNLLEALYFGCVGRSCRTRIEAQTIRFGESIARVEVDGDVDGEPHGLAVALERNEGKTMFVDGARADSFEPFAWRPPVAVFMPDRLELVKGPPGVRRAHLDQVVAALWPARRAARAAYRQALAQRNALLSASPSDRQLDAWDRELARCALELTRNRAAAAEQIASRFSGAAAELGLPSEATLRYRPGADVDDEEQFGAELARRRDTEIARGFSTYGPHRDELVISLNAREVRTYASQGQQRLALLALLLAECEAIAEVTARTPLILLDDVMSELDATRRTLLVDKVAGLGQVLITATERQHLPVEAPVDVQIRVEDGVARSERQ